MNTITTNKRITNKRDLIAALNGLDFGKFDIQEIAVRQDVSNLTRSLNRIVANKALSATVIVIDRKE
ncbi:MAG: hypothetical protein HOF91_00005 [Rhodospirillaceae bacterium]|nr:hypothetical protein [Rhodospirillaceae bacterium]MBT3778365.1 hypothetical protein [Rhodospirillaceae bacterium]MBT4563829.1 hypothetical protein [Rhodospirillaceae bacterium]